MEERESRKSSGMVVIVLFAGAALLPVLYVLSLGPAIWFAERFPRSEMFLGVIYTPLEWVCRLVPPLKTILDKYVELWR